MKLLIFAFILSFEVLVLGICKEITEVKVTENPGLANNRSSGSPLRSKQELQVARSNGGIDSPEAIGASKADKKDASLLRKAEGSISSFRSVWSHIAPYATILSSVVGLLVVFFLIESPLSPLPVPPLPHSPVGPFPPTGLYPLGIPPPRKKVKVWYSSGIPPQAAHKQVNVRYSAIPPTAYGHVHGRARNQNFLNFDIPAMNFIKRHFVNLKLNEFGTWNKKQFENPSKPSSATFTDGLTSFQDDIAGESKKLTELVLDDP